MVNDKKMGRPGKQFSEAKSWLLDYLADGDQPALTEISFASLKLDFSWATLKRAKVRLKIQSCHHLDDLETENTSQWFWTLRTRSELAEERMRKAEEKARWKAAHPVSQFQDAMQKAKVIAEPIPAIPIWQDSARLNEVLASGDLDKVHEAENEIVRARPNWFEDDPDSDVAMALKRLRDVAEQLASDIPL